MVGGVKALILLLVVVCVGCASTPKVVPNSPEAKARIETEIRARANKPAGKLTAADLEKVTVLVLQNNQLTDVTALKGLTQLTRLYLENNQLTDITALKELTQLTTLYLGGNQITNVTALKELTKLSKLYLYNNPALTKAQIDQLQKALPNCEIGSNPKK